MKRVHFSVLLICVIAGSIAYSAYSRISQHVKATAEHRSTLPMTGVTRPLPTNEVVSAPDASSDSPPPPPAWMNEAAEKDSSQKKTSPSAAAEERKQLLAAAIDHLQQLQSAGAAEPLQVAHAIEQLEKAHGSPVFHGTRLDVLRKNLELSQKIRLLAEEVGEITKGSNSSGTATSPEQQALLKIKKDQLDALARQIRMDVTTTQINSVSR